MLLSWNYDDWNGLLVDTSPEVRVRRPGAPVKDCLLFSSHITPSGRAGEPRQEALSGGDHGPQKFTCARKIVNISTKLALTPGRENCIVTGRIVLRNTLFSKVLPSADYVK